MDQKHKVAQFFLEDVKAKTITVSSVNGIKMSNGLIDGRNVKSDGKKLDDHISNDNNPHSLTPERIGLGSSDIPVFKNVVSNAPIKHNHLATKSYVDSILTSGSDIVFDEYSYNGSMSTTRVYPLLMSVLSVDVDKPSGKYRLGWCFSWSSNGKKIMVNLKVDNVVIDYFQATGFDGIYKESSFVYVNLNGLHNIEVEFTGDGWDDQVMIQNVRLELWKTL